MKNKKTKIIVNVKHMKNFGNSFQYIQQFYICAKIVFDF